MMRSKNLFTFHRKQTVLLIFFVFFLAGCASPADEQATAERLTAVVADQAAAFTRQAQETKATSQAFSMETATAEEAVATSAAQATVDAEATVEAIALAEAEAQATIDAEATEMVEATLQAEATTEAEAQATAAFEATMVAMTAEKLAQIEEAQSETPFADAREGSLVHDEDDEPETSSASVNLRNFVVQTQFAFNAGDSDFWGGDFVLLFRSGPGSFGCLMIEQDGHWQLIVEDEVDRETIQEGEVTDLHEGGWNELALYADEEQGFFFFNGEFIDELDLEQATGKGDIVVATGFSTDAEIVGAQTDYRDFTIWSLDPIPPTPTPAPKPTSPPQPTAAPQPTAPPAPAFGNGRIIFVNETADKWMEVFLWNCCEEFHIRAEPGETVIRELPADEYGWRVQGENCEGSMPNLFLTSGTDMIIFIFPADNECGMAFRWGEAQ